MSMLFKKIGSVIVAGAMLALILAPVEAIESTPPGRIRQEIRKEIKEQVKNRIVQVAGATIDAAGSSSLTISKEGKVMTVNITPTTKLRRRFWGKASLSEMSAGDTVNVWGSIADEGQTIINARLVRNTSIQKRNGVFIGEVTSLTPDGWVMKTAARGDQTVELESNTKFTDRGGRVIKQGDVVAGNRVRVRGMWDRKLKIISEVNAVKNYSLPTKTNTTASPSATP